MLITLLLALNAFALESPLATFDRAAALVHEKFYDQTFRGLPWDSLTSQARSRLSDRSTPAELESAVNDLLANLHASHTEFISRDDQEYYGLKSVFSGKLSSARIFQIGARFVSIDGKWFADCVFEGSPAARAGLLRGDEIVSVKGLPLEPVRSFWKGAPVQVEFRRKKDEATQRVWIKPEFASAEEELLTATQLSRLTFKVNGKRIAYLHLWSGTDDAFLAEAASLAAADADAVIYDLRDGFGGADARYSAPFLAPSFRKPLAVLINNGVRSGKEAVAYRLRERATLVGATTAGHYLAGALFDLVTDHYALYLAVAADPELSPILEGVGVPPAISVEAPVPYAAGADPQLTRAFELLSR